MNRCVPVLAEGSDLPRKSCQGLTAGQRTTSGGARRRTIRTPGKPRKAVVSLQIIAISAEWVKSNPCHCPRDIMQRPTKRAPGGSGAYGNRLHECGPGKSPASSGPGPKELDHRAGNRI